MASAVYPLKAQALAAARALTPPGLVVQSAGRFAVYATPADLDGEAGSYAGRAHCLEVLDPERARRPFVDVDGLAAPGELAPFLAAFRAMWGEPQPLRTARGWHVIGRSQWVSPADHKAGLLALNAEYPEVDVMARYTLRLPGTRKPGGACKEHPAGVPLSALLVQGAGAPVERTAGRPLELPIAEEAPAPLVTAASAALTGRTDVFKARPTRDDAGWVVLDRTAPAHCAVCDRVHDRDGAAVLAFAEGRAVAYCFRAAGLPGVHFTFEAPTAPQGPGIFESRAAADEYVGTECTAPAGDYIDGSPCGLGKSKAAWTSIDPAASVLCVSYRRSFTAKTAADYGLSLLPQAGSLVYRPGCGLRAIVQAESLPRVVVEKGGLEVLIVDELHGIGRQLLGPLAQGAKSRAALRSLLGLLAAADRVIVLDAQADDADFAALKLVRPRATFVRNVAAAPMARRVDVAATPGEAYQEMLTALAAGESVAVYAQALSRGACSVEEITNDLRARGYKVKSYSGMTGQDVRQADFADPEKAFEGVQAVVYNAALEAGVSIELTRFKTLIAFSSSVGSCEAAFQSLHRFRCVTRMVYSGQRGGRPGAGLAPQTFEGLQAAVDAGLRGLQLNEGAFVNAPLRSADLRGTFEGSLWASVQLEGYRSGKHFNERLLHLLGAAAWTIQDQQGRARVAMPAVDSVPAEQRVEARVARAAELDADQVERLRNDATPKTAETLESLARAAYVTTFSPVDGAVTPEDLVKFKGRGDAWRAYQKLLLGAPPGPPRGPAIGGGRVITAMAPPAEIRKLAGDLAEAIGFGPLTALAETRPVAPSAIVPPEAVVRAVTAAGWGRLCPGTDLPAALKKGAKLTPSNVVGLLRAIIGRHYGLRVENSNERNPARGVYRILPGDWPALRGLDTFAEQKMKVRAMDAPQIPPPRAAEPPPDYDVELGDFVANITA